MGVNDEKVSAEERDMALTIETTPANPTRIPYKNGYGDFFFGLIPYWERPENLHTWDGIKDPVVEWDIFKRCACFRIPQKRISMLTIP